MSCESCTGCFSASPCSAPLPSVNGRISKEYRQFLKYASLCDQYLDGGEEDSSKKQAADQLEDRLTEGGKKTSGRKSGSNREKEDHAFNIVIGILADGQFTAQTFLAQSYKQLGSRRFLELSRLLAHHGFWGRLVTWAYLFVKEDNESLRSLLEAQSSELAQAVNDEAEMFEVFNPGVSCQRVQDTAGQERYKAWSLAPMYYRNANCAVVVYDVTQASSLDKAKSWVKELQRQADPNIVIALAGNKSDLSARRVIETEEAQAYADEAGLLFFETSAKTAANVNELFTSIAKRMPLDMLANPRPRGTGLNARGVDLTRDTKEAGCAC
ncbi:GTP-binding protein of the rab/ypt [Podila epigama]|nr:GTP-binding protein of the rab/ypt [Podila epigama]